ncbi:MAG: CBS domain-containing protein [Gammaproteobacteria bacterium]
MIVEEMMTNEVVTSTAEESLFDVLRKLSSNKFSCIVIVEEKKPIGIITERDLVELLIEMLQGVKWEELAIKNFMTTPVIAVDEDMLLEEVIDLAHRNAIRHMPVVHKGTGELVGILTQTDIVEGFYQEGS